MKADADVILGVWEKLKGNPELQRAFAAAVCGVFSGTLNHDHAMLTSFETAYLFQTALREAEAGP